MTIEETRKRILEDDEFVLSEIEKLRYLYKLKKEIRYAQTRNEVVDTESVAEHVYGMHVLANYFLPLEDRAGEWDKLKILETITWHDMDEIETGDTISHKKTKQHQLESEAAWPKVIANLPETIRSHTEHLIHEYEARETPEARFVKAVDKAEPLFEIRFESYKMIMHANDNTLENHWETKRRYVEGFPYILRFVEVATDRLKNDGYFKGSGVTLTK